MKSSFAALLLAGSALASPVATSNKWTPRALSGLNYEIINLARNLESLELNLWNQGLNNFTDQDFNNANLTGFRTWLTLFRDQEISHFSALNTALGGGFTNCTYTFPITNVTELVTLGQVITTVGEGAFIGGIANLTDSGARLTGANIVTNEARQNSKLREYAGLDYFNAVNFDTALTATQAYSLAEPFFKCPSSNPAIEFPLVPALTAAFQNGTTPHYPGQLIDISWDASKVYLGDNVHIQFLADVYSIAVPLNQTGTGTGVTALPESINGTSILVATDYTGGGPIPDNLNFAIGFVVVA